MKIAKKLLTGVLGLGAALTLFGCNKASKETASSADGTITLNVWHQWANDSNELKKDYEKCISEYEASHPNIKIVSESLDSEAYKTKMRTEFAGNASGVDVFYWWGAGTAKSFVNAGKLLAFDDYLTPEIKQRILPGSTGAFEFDGKTYSLPMFSWYMTLFCNTELFEKAGAKIPSNYDELVDAVNKLSKLDGVEPLASGAKDGWNAAFVYQALALRENGADNVNSMLGGSVPFGGKGYEEAAQKVMDLYRMGAFGKNPLEENNDDASSKFITGKAAMRLMGSWFANQVYTDASATVDPSKIVACKIPMIGGKGNASDYCGGFVESFWVNKNVKYPKEAVELAVYLNEKMGQYSYETGSGFSGWKGTYDESRLNPLFIQIKDILSEGKTGVLAWDTSLESEAAAVHNEMVQTLFSPDGSVKDFIQAHEDVINK